jgi:hypothetical protein
LKVNAFSRADIVPLPVPIDAGHCLAMRVSINFVFCFVSNAANCDCFETRILVKSTANAHQKSLDQSTAVVVSFISDSNGVRCRSDKLND